MSQQQEVKYINKADLISKIHERYNEASGVIVSEDTVYNAVNVMIEHLISTIASGERVEVRGFGSFNLACYEPRIGRNPKTGEKVEVPARSVPHFKAGKILKAKIDRSVA